MKGSKTQIVFRIFLLIGLIALVGGLLWFWLRPPQVSVTEVTERRITPSIQGVGTVEAKTVVMLSAKISGKIIFINVDQGDAVLPGQVLATLEDFESRAEVDRAEASRQRSRTSADVQLAAIQRSQTGTEIQAAAISRARAYVEVQKASLRRAQAGLLASETAISKARALQNQAQVNADRWIRLERDGIVSKMDTEERITQVKTANEDVKNAEAQRNAAIQDVKNAEAQIKAAGEDVKQAEAQSKAARDDVATSQAGLKVVEQDIAIANAALASTRARGNDTEIVSQIAGYVVSRELEPGAVVNPGTPILKIADPTTIWATVFIDEINSKSFEVGDAAEIILRSMGSGKLQGKVTRIQRESDRVTEQTAVDISFDQIPANIRLGEQLEAIIKPQPRTVRAIPASALIRSKDGIGVWLVNDSRLKFRKVQTGMVDASGWAEVISGLESGDKVVVSPGKLSDLSNEGRRVAMSNEL